MTSRIIIDDVTKIMIFCQILSKNEDNPKEPPYNPIFIFFASECKLALSSPPNSETVIENHFFYFSNWFSRLTSQKTRKSIRENQESEVI